MILDSGCEVGNCSMPTELVKGQNYKTSNGITTIYFIRCASNHYYMRLRTELEESMDSTNHPFSDNQDDLFFQDELPFGE